MSFQEFDSPAGAASAGAPVQDFLVELGTEELPPKSLPKLAEGFQSGLEKGLKSAGLHYQSAVAYAAPRRLAVVVYGLTLQQPDRNIELDGPPLEVAFDDEGEPTAAALGFARKCGVELAELDRSGPKLRFAQHLPGQATAQLLPSLVQEALESFPIARRMRWGAHREEFARPTQWLVMLLGEEVVEGRILAQTAGRDSHGHRFHHPGPVRISKPSSYLEDLRAGWVIADFSERRNLIAEGVKSLASDHQGVALLPETLLDEVTGLVEWPVPLICSFEERFLDVPQEALISTMQDNQKYFCLVDESGKLMPRFVTVANIQSQDFWQIVHGNEKVVRPRLTDAEFFFLQDRKRRLEDFRDDIRNQVFEASLGSLYDKSQRVCALAGFIAERIGGDRAHAERAGQLCKNDLATALVGEFPELQGVAGYYYARHDDEPFEVAQALKEQYLPQGAGGDLPGTVTGAALAVADRLDTLVGIFGVGMPPTGSKDPYALRRAALGVLRILIDKKLELPLDQTLAFAIGQYQERVNAQGLQEQVQEFVFDRLRARYEDEGVDTNVYLAVRALQPMSPWDFQQRVEAVQAFRRLPEAEALAAANKRVSNLLAKFEGPLPERIQAHFFDSPSEFALYAALQKAEQAIQPLAEKREYEALLARLAQLRKPIDDFFEAVLVNVEEPDVRANRYAILAQLRRLFWQVADIAALG